MKKLILSMGAVFLLAAVSGPAWADDAMAVKTPVVKTMKHKAKQKKKKMKRGKKAAEPSATPTAAK